MALREALAPLGQYRCDGHLTTLSTAPEEDVISIVRDPVERYVSAFWWLSTKTRWPWPSPDVMAAMMDTQLVANAFTRYMVLWPQSHWLNADRPLLWLGHTESLSADVARLGPLLGATLELPQRNVGRYPHQPLSAAATTTIREYYADDYELLRRLDA